MRARRTRHYVQQERENETERKRVEKSFKRASNELQTTWNEMERGESKQHEPNRIETTRNEPNFDSSELQGSLPFRAGFYDTGGHSISKCGPILCHGGWFGYPSHEIPDSKRLVVNPNPNPAQLRAP